MDGLLRYFYFCNILILILRLLFSLMFQYSTSLDLQFSMHVVSTTLSVHFIYFFFSLWSAFSPDPAFKKENRKKERTIVLLQYLLYDSEIDFLLYALIMQIFFYSVGDMQTHLNGYVDKLCFWWNSSPVIRSIVIIFLLWQGSVVSPNVADFAMLWSGYRGIMCSYAKSNC